MEKMIAHIHVNGVIYLQRSDYIEDGCFVRIDGSEIELYEIPHGGGEPNCVGDFETILEALDFSKTLT